MSDVISFHDPRAEPGAAIEAYELTIDPSEGAVDIGLLANGFPDSVKFLDEVESALRRALPTARFHRYDKGNASAIVSDRMLGEIVAECRAVVAAYGH